VGGFEAFPGACGLLDVQSATRCECCTSYRDAFALVLQLRPGGASPCNGQVHSSNYRTAVALEVQFGMASSKDPWNASKLPRFRSPLRIKFGIDPTGPDIHIGHAVSLLNLRLFQRMATRSSSS